MPAIISDAVLLSIFSPLECFPSAALAVSGGPDSLALMHLVRRWITLMRREAASITVLTVDHRLRPESGSEAEFVAQSAIDAGFTHTVLPWTGPKPHTGIQAAARKERYRLLTSHCKLKGIACLVTAHTEDDQAETLLMRLRRGSGLDGFAAMAQVSDRDGLPLVRPLLGLSKRRLVTYLRASGLPVLNDPSNENSAFERVRLRHAMKALAGAGISSQALAVSARRLGRSREALSKTTEDFLLRHFRVTSLGRGEMRYDLLSATPDDLRIRALSRVLTLIGGTNDPPRLAKLERLVHELGCGPANATLGRCLISVSAGTLYFYREPGRSKPAPILAERGSSLIWDGRFALSLGEEIPDGAVVRQLGPNGWVSYRKSLKQKSIPVNADHLAAMSTPALWSDKTLLYAPTLGFANGDIARSAAPQISAQLVPQLAPFLNRI